MNSEKCENESYYDSRLKRAIDLVVGVVGLAPAVVVSAVVGLANKLEDGGSVFFVQERIGKNGDKFKMLKLRTYNADGEITRIGKIIRPLGLDELPQAFNILRGDMSVFGIRALSDSDFDGIIEKYRSHEGFSEDFLNNWILAYQRHRPGGLSLAVSELESVLNRRYETPESVKDKMRRDIEQVEKASFMNDMAILTSLVSKVF